MKRKQQNLIWPGFVTFIITARLSKLTDLQTDHENTAGNKKKNLTLDKYESKRNIEAHLFM